MQIYKKNIIHKKIQYKKRTPKFHFLNTSFTSNAKIKIISNIPRY